MQIIKISAIWCPSCLIMNDRIKNIANKYNLDLLEYDYDFDEDIVNKYNPGKVLPVIIIVDNEKEILRIIGEKDEIIIDEMIKEVVK